MKKLLIILSLLIAQPAFAADKLNDFVFKDFYNQDVKLDEYNLMFRKGLVVNIWASWCVPCVKELPSLMRLQQITPEVTVIGINVDKDINKAKQFFKRQNLPDTVMVNLFDKNAEQIKKLGVSSLPVTFLVDRNGNIVKRFDGFHNWVDEMNIAKIKSNLSFY
jgi:thiol-disulfide isomerase/thioredoxin